MINTPNQTSYPFWSPRLCPRQPLEVKRLHFLLSPKVSLSHLNQAPEEEELLSMTMTWITSHHLRAHHLCVPITAEKKDRSQAGVETGTNDFKSSCLHGIGLLSSPASNKGFAQGGVGPKRKDLLCCIWSGQAYLTAEKSYCSGKSCFIYQQLTYTEIQI